MKAAPTAAFKLIKAQLSRFVMFSGIQSLKFPCFHTTGFQWLQPTAAGVNMKLHAKCCTVLQLHTDTSMEVPLM